ncbi:unnamed protein product [Amoebophrya sp. A120]|nr:unnamed protein product [Amoebophrya sp. A120]|eukprot:GSA120T00010221001.1
METRRGARPVFSRVRSNDHCQTGLGLFPNSSTHSSNLKRLLLTFLDHTFKHLLPVIASTKLSKNHPNRHKLHRQALRGPHCEHSCVSSLHLSLH